MQRTFAEILTQVGGYYTDKIRAHGTTAKGVDWNSESSQELRYQQLLRIAVDPRATVSGENIPLKINDIGCGYGYMCGYLDTLGISADYYGLDISPTMIAAAQATYGHRPATQFGTEAELVPVADFSVASGIFNVRFRFTDDEWESYLASMLKFLHAKSRRGFAFNMLTRYSDQEKMRSDLYYAQPAAIFDLCKREYSRNVALLHDYDLYEFTILVRL